MSLKAERWCIWFQRAAGWSDRDIIYLMDGLFFEWTMLTKDIVDGTQDSKDPHPFCLPEPPGNPQQWPIGAS